MKIISDERLLKVPIKDNGEKLVDIKKYCPKVIVRPGAYIKKEGEKYFFKAAFVREGVAKRILVAQDLLPEGYKIILRCGYRPLSLQKKRYLWMYNKLKKKNSDWSKNKLAEETSKCVAPPDIVPPHSTGGAIDISILGANERQLDMGTRLGEFNEKTYTKSKMISSVATNNRSLLIKAMAKAGFVNYPTEWWHWSYGDRYWAAVKKKRYSIYNGL
ncbi:MAG: D-alanyl-D-alanine dipeptidase [Parcubacteria group bacterium ADurb.Bin316]|nr:MAG: D-alanyl-D-alanine dipeptidase [Parcubacteria group bacterium ADurb.Bin316]HOZ56530.1 M15 family metallopeptidase [bacterium]